MPPTAILHFDGLPAKTLHLTSSCCVNVPSSFVPVHSMSCAMYCKAFMRAEILANDSLSVSVIPTQSSPMQETSPEHVVSVTSSESLMTTSLPQS